MNTLITNLKNERESVKASLAAIVEKAGVETRDLTDTEEKNVEDLTKRLDEIDARLEQLVEIEVRNAKAADLMSQLPNSTPQGGARVTREQTTYFNGASSPSFFRDLVNARNMNDPAAMERLNRNRREQEVEMRDANTQTSDLSNGFVPPLYLGNDFAELRKYGRPVANYIGSRPLTHKSMSIPRVTQGTSTGFASEEASLSAQGFTSSDITADSKIVGGYVDVTTATLDWANGFTDADIYQDLVKNYNQDVETMVLANNVSNAYGILEVSGTNQVLYDTNPATWATLFPKIAAAKKSIYTSYYGSPDAMVIHPTMFAFLEGLLDGNNRPVFTEHYPSNAPGVVSNNIAEGPVGRAFGLNVIVSNGIPADYLDSATPSDIPVVIGALKECRLWESGVKTARFDDVGSATLQVRFRMHGYVAFTAARHPGAISILYGAGLTSTALGF